MRSENLNRQEDIIKQFAQFLRQKEQRTELIIMAAVIAVVGVIFHILYPFPFTFPDSGAYVLTAQQDIFNVYRPMGYSSYLSFLHIFSSSATFVFIFSYFIGGLSTLLLLFSAKFLIGIKTNWLFWSMSLFAILALRLIFSTNFIMSDSLFTTLTMVFMATAIWVVYSRNVLILGIHLLCFVALFKVRYSGMFYLPVSIIAIYISYLGSYWTKKLVCLVPLVLFALLFSSTKKEYLSQTGVDTFSAFSGWQLINNASVLIPQAKQISMYEFERDEKPFHEFLSTCPDSLFSLDNAMTTNCMWSKELPYKQYLSYYLYTSGYDYTLGWVQMGKMYGGYAGKIIRRYPAKYFTEFVVPSFVSNFKCWNISEENIVFTNEPLYAQYFGITEQTYRHENRLFAKLHPVRKVLNWIYWLSLAAAITLICTTISRANFRSRRWLSLALILFFILLYIATSAIASPNTTWRYTMAIFVPSLIFIFGCLQSKLKD